MKNLSTFFKDGYGNLSATRLAFLLWVLGVLIAWFYLSVIKGALLPIDNTIVALIGVLMTGKAVQSFSPSDGPTPPAAPK